jgi:hypothetical protein
VLAAELLQSVQDDRRGSRREGCDSQTAAAERRDRLDFRVRRGEMSRDRLSAFNRDLSGLREA